MPLHETDIELTSANLATTSYRLGLAYGVPLDWHRDAAAAAVAGETGGLWQHFARELRGLIPLWGLESKVALTYGGTVVACRALQAWLDSGHAPSDRELRELYRTAAADARRVSRSLVGKARGALPGPGVRRAGKGRLTLRLPGLPRQRRKPICSHCGRSNPWDASYCAYCGQQLAHASASETDRAASDSAEARREQTPETSRSCDGGLKDTGTSKDGP